MVHVESADIWMAEGQCDYIQPVQPKQIEQSRLPVYDASNLHKVNA